jgi:seryl-tRNA synthetase
VYVDTAVLAAGHTSAQSSGFPTLTVFGIVGTTIGIIAAAQQFLSGYKRRNYKSAEEKFLKAIEASEAISSSLSQVKQYQAIRERLRKEIESQIPKQARNAYLVNRLEQLTDDLHQIYADYQDVRRELGEGNIADELDQRVRDAIRMSTPSRRARERRSLYMEAYAKLSLKKYRPMAARNEDKKVFSGLL